MQLISMMKEIKLNKQENFLTQHFDIICVTLINFTFHVTSYETGCHLAQNLLDDMESSQLFIIVLTSLKFLMLLARHFDQANNFLNTSLKNGTHFCGTKICKQLYGILELWNNVYGIFLLQLFLHILIVLIDNIVNVVPEIKINFVSWKVVIMCQTIVIYLVFNFNCFTFV